MNVMDADLYVAASEGNFNSIMNLRDKINQVTQGNHETILHLAAMSNLSTCVSAIIDEFPSLFGKVNSAKETALHLAASKGYKDVLEVLISKSKQFHSKDFIRKGNLNLDTALHLAARSNHEVVVRLLVEADPSNEHTQNSQFETPLYLAATAGNANMIKTIFDNCRNASPDGPEGRTALHAAVINRKWVCIEVILQYRGDLYGRADVNGWTAFHHAASLKCEPELDWLIELGNPNTRGGVMAMTSTVGMKTSLHLAAYEGHIFIVLQLMKYCPDSVPALDDDGRNILHIAAERNHKELFCSILDNGPSDIDELFNVADENGNTPLHLLVLAGCYVPRFVRDPLVIKDAKNKSNFTPFQLMYEDEDIIGSQLMIWEAHPEEFWGVGKREPELVESVVLESKRNRKTAKFKIAHTKRVAENAQSNSQKNKDNLVVTALVATVTFTVGFTMPGGYHDGDTGDANKGMAILSRKAAFILCMIADAMGFLFSAYCLVLYFLSVASTNPGHVSSFTTMSAMLNLFSICSMVITFCCGTYVVLSSSPALAISIVVISTYFILSSISLIAQLRQLPVNKIRF